MLNVTNTQDILDKANCRYHIYADGTVGRMKAAAFSKDRITNGKLFRVLNLTSYFYTTDMLGSFKEIVEANGLAGLLFKEC